MERLNKKIGEEPVFQGIAFEGLLFRSACGEDDAAAPLLDVVQRLLRQGRGRYAGSGNECRTRSGG